MSTDWSKYARTATAFDPALASTRPDSKRVPVSVPRDLFLDREPVPCEHFGIAVEAHEGTRVSVVVNASDVEITTIRQPGWGEDGDWDKGLYEVKVAGIPVLACDANERPIEVLGENRRVVHFFVERVEIAGLVAA